MPRNRELMRVYKDIGLVEQLGSGMTRILDAYDEEIFDFSDNFLTVTFKFNDGFENKVTNNTLNVTLNEKEIKILDIIRQNKKISADEFSVVLNVSARTIKRYLTILQDKEVIKRIGSKKTGE